MQDDLSEYIGKIVVIDTRCTYIYIGTLESISEYFLVLTHVDVHDSSEFNKSKELYVMEALKYGVKANRERTKMVRSDMISISLLTEVLEF